MGGGIIKQKVIYTFSFAYPTLHLHNILFVYLLTSSSDCKANKGVFLWHVPEASLESGDNLRME